MADVKCLDGETLCTLYASQRRNGGEGDVKIAEGAMTRVHRLEEAFETAVSVWARVW